jgi:hypothetical protein
VALRGRCAVSDNRYSQGDHLSGGRNAALAIRIRRAIAQVLEKKAELPCTPPRVLAPSALAPFLL